SEAPRHHRGAHGRHLLSRHRPRFARGPSAGRPRGLREIHARRGAPARGLRGALRALPLPRLHRPRARARSLGDVVAEVPRMTAVAFSLLGIEMRLAEAGRWPWALAVVLALLAFLHGLARRERMLRDLTAVPALRARIVPGLAPGRGVLRGALALAALAAIFVALLRPQVGQREVTVKRRGIDIVVALDASRSMLARDVLPSRLARAKLELSQLVDRLQGDRIGIVVFAGEAFV